MTIHFDMYNLFISLFGWFLLRSSTCRVGPHYKDGVSDSTWETDGTFHRPDNARMQMSIRTHITLTPRTMDSTANSCLHDNAVTYYYG